MLRDYMIVSPSLDGVLSHDSVVYEGIKRPTDILRAFDSPATKGVRIEKTLTEVEQEVLARYLNDLFGLFTKNLSHLVINPDPKPDDTVKLQAMLQEIIKVKKLMVH